MTLVLGSDKILKGVIKQMYSKYSKYGEIPDNTVVEKLETVNDSEIVIETPILHIRGQVYECFNLNVRSEPSLTAKIITTIPVGCEVDINMDESTDEFYKIQTDNGVEGFCLQEHMICFVLDVGVEESYDHVAG